jgi:hypothetical protein
MLWKARPGLRAKALNALALPSFDANRPGKRPICSSFRAASAAASLKARFSQEEWINRIGFLLL